MNKAVRSVLLCAVLLAVGGLAAIGQQPDRGLTVPGQYIVVFKDTVADVPGMALHLARAQGGTPLFIYQHALKGFAATLPEQAVEALSRNPNVAYVEPDSVVWAFGALEDATWGLDRIDQRSLPLDRIYNYTATGAGVTAYVIDTGILTSHAEFEGRATFGWDFVDNDSDATDCNGHGTHVAGTIGGKTYGVAKAVDLVAVRVLDCSGSGATSGVIAGIDWVTAHHTAAAVANMSLGGGASTALDAAVQKSIAAGVSYAVAAGNGNFAGIAQNACNYSPARVPEAMTVGATNSADTKASWSNYGDCVDWFAPGVGITSAWITNITATNTISGTSMATPHTAGVAALYLQMNPEASPQEVRDALYAATTKGIVLNSKTANNHLLYSLFGEPPANVAPVANFTFATSGRTVAFTDASTDSDGTVTGWSWTFGDGGTSTLPSPSHTYGADGTYGVTLTVTDNDGATASIGKSVAVTSTSKTIVLSVSVTNTKNVKKAALTWTPATSGNVEIYRNEAKIATTTNTSTYTDNLGKKAAGAYVYYIKEVGTGAVSNSVTVNF